jgi:hypothetical protein
MSKGDYKDGCVDLGKSLFEFILYEGIYVKKSRRSLTCFVRGLVGLGIAISTSSIRGDAAMSPKEVVYKAYAPSATRTECRRLARLMIGSGSVY